MSKQKVWFVTGASKGFGRLWSEAALKRGDKVAATARKPEDLQGLVEVYGDSVLPLQLDVTNRENVFRSVNETREHFGRIDVVLSNAGYGSFGAIEEVAFDEARNVFETNVFGTLSVLQAAIPLLREQGSGHILTLSSIGGLVSFPTSGVYGATKFAVEALSESLAAEVADSGIKVTIIEPGSYATQFGASRKVAPSIGAYDDVKRAVYGAFKPEMTGNPEATAAAILQIVDSEEPPLRIILGSTVLPMVRKAYEERIEEWRKWEHVSAGAQG